MLRATEFNPDQKPWILTYCHYLWYYVCWWCPRLPAKSQVFPSICGHNNCQSGNSSPCQWGRKPTIIVLTIYIYPIVSPLHVHFGSIFGGICHIHPYHIESEHRVAQNLTVYPHFSHESGCSTHPTCSQWRWLQWCYNVTLSTPEKNWKRIQTQLDDLPCVSFCDQFDIFDFLFVVRRRCLQSPHHGALLRHRITGTVMCSVTGFPAWSRSWLRCY